jgi:hypothetical protein
MIKGIDELEIKVKTFVSFHTQFLSPLPSPPFSCRIHHHTITSPLLNILLEDNCITPWWLHPSNNVYLIHKKKIYEISIIILIGVNRKGRIFRFVRKHENSSLCNNFTAFLFIVVVVLFYKEKLNIAKHIFRQILIFVWSLRVRDLDEVIVVLCFSPSEMNQDCPTAPKRRWRITNTKLFLVIAAYS